MNRYYNTRPDIVEMILLYPNEGDGFMTTTTEEAWRYLEHEFGLIKDERGRAEWKDPTPTGDRMIAIACTKTNGETFDGSITAGGKKVAVFRFGRFEEE